MYGKLKGVMQIAAGVAFWIVAIIAELAWLGACFGSVVVGLVLLLFAPWLLLAPLAAITLPGNGLIYLGMVNLFSNDQPYRTRMPTGRVYESELSKPLRHNEGSGRSNALLKGPQKKAASQEVGGTPFGQMDFKKIKKYAKKGYAHAQYELGRKYAKGEDVEKNATQALVWFKRAADQGHTDAQYEVGVMFLNGYGTIKKPRVAIKWFLKSAEQGSQRAMFNLGYIYANAEDSLQDGNEAIKWYRRASECGSAKALYNLGSLYYYGQGVPVNKGKAVKWYRQAAENLDANAQFKLGELYVIGDGVAQDASEAKKWYSLAADQGHEGAQKRMELLDILEDEADGGSYEEDVLNAGDEEKPLYGDEGVSEANYSISKEGFSVMDSGTGHAMMVSYDGSVYQGQVLVPEFGIKSSMGTWQRGENPFEDDSCYWVTQWNEDIDDLVQIIIRPDRPFSLLMAEVEQLNRNSSDIAKFKKKSVNEGGGSLQSIVAKQHDTGYLFADMMNDLALAADDIMASGSEVRMAYGYARRCAAAALYLQGLCREEDFEHASTMFKGLQAVTGHTVKFQEDAAADAVRFMRTYSSQISKLFARKVASTAMGFEPSGKVLPDAELFGLVIHMAYQEQQRNLA